MTLCNKLYIPCSIFVSTMADIYGISRIPSAAKALTRPTSKYMAASTVKFYQKYVISLVNSTET